ncbi:hypothetical protein X758_23335 [Mesorhizobium sp. LSHC416B00]|nr:hypothetical protein [Mesorhizobium sp. LSHC416B00]ESX68125.1 hypothetical protein X758_23335 [Mesorhizobium sp. LSHC416B00]
MQPGVVIDGACFAERGFDQHAAEFSDVELRLTGIDNIRLCGHGRKVHQRRPVLKTFAADLSIGPRTNSCLLFAGGFV